MSQTERSLAVRRAVAVAVLALLGGCRGEGEADETVPPTTTPSFPTLGAGAGSETPPLPDLDPDRVALGREIYTEHCASCHGADAEGQPDWMIPNEDGSYKPPPHDATGHTWHHGDDLLVEIILVGSDFPQSRMPAYAGVLSEDETLAILDYFKSLWGPTEREIQWNITWRAQQGG